MFLGDDMRLGDIAEVRTGAVLTRKREKYSSTNKFFKSINLKCVSEDGTILLNNIETIELPLVFKDEVFARVDDIIVRLSAPYSAAIINQEAVGCLIPSHFAIIRVDRTKIYPPYLLWYLNSEEVKKKILQNNSGSTAFGTISSGFFADLDIKEIDMYKQKLLGDYMLLFSKEKRLTEELLEQKTIYNKYITKKLYEEIKRGK